MRARWRRAAGGGGAIVRARCNTSHLLALPPRRLRADSQGVVHRDIKPENILLHRPAAGAPPVAKLCDFGWSVVMRVDSRRDTLCGTVEYLAPEVVENRDHDFTYDSWMLGCLIYEMLVGVSPFAAGPADAAAAADAPPPPPPTEAEIVARIVAGRFRFPPGTVSASAADLITKLLRVDRTGRLSPSAVLRHPWVVRHAGVSPRPPPPPAPGDPTRVCLAPWPELRSETWSSAEARAAAVEAYDAELAALAAAGVRAAPPPVSSLSADVLADLAEFAADARAAEARGTPLPSWAAATAASPAAIAAELARLPPPPRGGALPSPPPPPRASAAAAAAVAALISPPRPLTGNAGLMSPRLALASGGGANRVRTPGAIKRGAAPPPRGATDAFEL